MHTVVGEADDRPTHFAAEFTVIDCSLIARFLLGLSVAAILIGVLTRRESRPQ